MASLPAAGEPHAVNGSEAVLQVRDLVVEFDTEFGTAVVVDGVDLTLQRGMTLGLVGESGSGKSVTAMSIMGLIGRTTGRIREGTIMLDGVDIRSLSREQLAQVCGRDISMIFQEPSRSLDPSFKVGSQIAEVARRHLDLSRKMAWERAIEMLDRVGIPNAGARAHEYPHMFSGGMCQRVMLAMALVASPKVLIADEPTTALDVTVQAQVLDLIVELQRDLGLAVMFITHDLAVVAELCDRVAVMYAGQIVEEASIGALLASPRHPYTEGLFGSLPQAQERGNRLTSIAGIVPPPFAWPTGCRFSPRCRYALEACTETNPPLEVVDSDGHQSRCIRTDELELRGVR